MVLGRCGKSVVMWTMMEECIHKCLRTSCQCIIAVSMPLASSVSVYHNSGIVNTGISGLSLCFFWGEVEVGSDYMCTGHAVLPACRLVIADSVLVIWAGMTKWTLTHYFFLPQNCLKHPNNNPNKLHFKIKHTFWSAAFIFLLSIYVETRIREISDLIYHLTVHCYSI